MRTLVIGDIHGGYRALAQVFERAAVTDADKLIFLGDYVDGWSESAKVIEYLKSISKKQSCIFLKGNHDAWCEEWLRTGNAAKTWLSQGGQSTARSYLGTNELQRQEHLAFFHNMLPYYIDEHNRLFVHAGFTSMHGPAKERDPAIFSWDRTLWETALTLDKTISEDSLLYPKRLKLFDEIFIGHTPTLYYDVKVPMQGCNVWNVDTGAAFTGALTVMDIDTKQFWQSGTLLSLYPAESGRNKV